jgi:hypothetical protein
MGGRRDTGRGRSGGSWPREVTTTLTVYAHLINTDDRAGNMAALGALAAPKPHLGGKCCAAARLGERVARR